MSKKHIKTALLLLAMFIFSCNSEKTKKINEKSTSIFNKAIENMLRSKALVNIDSLTLIFETYKSEDPKKGLDFAEQLELKANNILKESEIENARYLAWFDSVNGAVNKSNKKAWDNSKAGKLQKKHPEWSEHDCLRVIDGEIWIGMTLDMLKYQRGLPDNVNPSNYGNGVKWQWCWYDHTPRCFYGGEDGIITSYN